MPGPLTSRRSYTPGSSASGRRIEREQGAAATTGRSAGEGIPGSGSFEGAVRTYRDRKRTKRAALARIRKVYKRLPESLTDANPKIRVNRPIDTDAKGRYIPGKNVIKLSEGTTRDLGGESFTDLYEIPRSAQKGAQHVLIHELMHANQRRDKPLPEWLSEGAADLMARKLSRRLFGYKGDTDHSYQPYVRAVKKRGGGTASYARRTLRD